MVFIVLALFLVSMVGVVSAAVGPPCDNEQLREMSEYIIQGEVTSSEITETFNITGEEEDYVEIGRVTLEIKVLNSIKGDNQVDDILSVDYETILTMVGEYAGGSYSALFDVGDLVEYRKLGEAYDQTCDFYELVAISEISEEITDLNETDDDDELPNITRIHRTKELKERLQIYLNATECPNNCVCSGSTIRCLVNGQRTMTVIAGRSGNIIIQVKGVNATTNVTLYKADGKLYGKFDNETKRIHDPEQIQEKIRQRKQKWWEEHNITLDEDGYYRVQSKKKARLFFLIPVREKVRTQIDAETGEIIKIRNHWWGVLARNEISNI